MLFRLVNPGVVDRLIVLDGIPERFMTGIDITRPEGLPRHWKKFEEKHYTLFYKTLNKDKEKWAEVTTFLKRVCDAKIRLTDKIEDMAIPMAPDAKEQVNIEPEDIPVIPIPEEFRDKPLIAPNAPPAPAPAQTITDTNNAQLSAAPQPAKKPGRPKKVAVA